MRGRDEGEGRGNSLKDGTSSLASLKGHTHTGIPITKLMLQLRWLAPPPTHLVKEGVHSSLLSAGLLDLAAAGHPHHWVQLASEELAGFEDMHSDLRGKGEGGRERGGREGGREKGGRERGEGRGEGEGGRERGKGGGGGRERGKGEGGKGGGEGEGGKGEGEGGGK